MAVAAVLLVGCGLTQPTDLYAAVPRMQYVPVDYLLAQHPEPCPPEHSPKGTYRLGGSFRQRFPALDRPAQLPPISPTQFHP